MPEPVPDPDPDPEPDPEPEPEPEPDPEPDPEPVWASGEAVLSDEEQAARTPTATAPKPNERKNAFRVIMGTRGSHLAEVAS